MNLNDFIQQSDKEVIAKMYSRPQDVLQCYILMQEAFFESMKV